MGVNMSDVRAPRAFPVPWGSIRWGCLHPAYPVPPMTNPRGCGGMRTGCIDPGLSIPRLFTRPRFGPALPHRHPTLPPRYARLYPGYAVYAYPPLSSAP